ncbi:MAG TPA: tRNA pseudouridine(55) synthase TruB [Phycisphaerales bacterium]|nr:tRNA pseudouridine(55) synthase TruB [Phycisphaerales bacterium]HCD34160.1 tRNA pseudouridine(55) synthase TruB [Phycisphaerales bacterium]|tara:strand:+ start:120 stop:833 length:714 start_codon:yes stop_codon:yes gene_type:complete
MGRKPYSHSNLNGLLIVDKPMGWSSMDVIRRIRRATDRCKAGHAGTLDPLATGVVVCCLGKATKLVDSLMGTTKKYITKVDLSAFTQTDDLEGEREEVSVDTPPSRQAVIEALAQLTGEIQQIPPMYSAIHIDGQRAYKLARKGEEVHIDPRTVMVHDIQLMNYTWPYAELDITCGKGTYIRSIARDLGKILGTGGHCASLRRTAVGQYTVDEAIPGSRLETPITQEDLIQVQSVGE